MNTHPRLLPERQAVLRQQVLERFAALFENQTRTRLFATSVTDLTHDTHAEIMANLQSAILRVSSLKLGPTELAEITTSLEQAAARCARLDKTLELLIAERRRQWQRNARDLQQVMFEFNRMTKDLAGTLIEKDLLERQSRVLETIVLSHEKVTQWKAFVQEVLLGFHAFFPFDVFFIAFAENNNLSLNIYYMGSYSEEVT